MRENKHRTMPRDITLSAVFAVLTSIGAWISIPITPVPVTLQVFFVLLSGAILGSRRGALSQITYLMLGSIGFPIFAGLASGPGVVVGPTGGYLFGFILGAYLTGRIVEVKQTRRLSWMILSTLSGLLPIYLLGSIWLSVWLNGSLTTVLSIGVLPFLPVDALKACLAALIAHRLRATTFFLNNGKGDS